MSRTKKQKADGNSCMLLQEEGAKMRKQANLQQNSRTRKLRKEAKNTIGTTIKRKKRNANKTKTKEKMKENRSLAEKKRKRGKLVASGSKEHKQSKEQMNEKQKMKKKGYIHCSKKNG